MEIVKCRFVFFIAVISIPCCETAAYGPKRIRDEFEAVRADMSLIRKDISALFDKTDQLNISTVEDCGLCVSEKNTSCPAEMDHDGRQDMAKVNDNNVLVKYQRLMKAFATEKKINQELISASERLAFDREQELQSRLKLMEDLISSSEKVAKKRDQEEQNRLQSMEDVISDIRKNVTLMNQTIKLTDNGRDLELQRRLRSMEDTISASEKVANERDRQVQEQLRSMRELIEDLQNNFSSFMKTITDRKDEHSLQSKTTTVMPEITTVPIVNTNCLTVPESGVYTLYLELIMSNVTVYCDQDTDGGGWIVFMRRQDGSVNFDRSWVDYKHGFGSPNGEFWVGNELLHKLTKERPLQLRIDMEDFDGNAAFAMYEEFQVGAEEDKYRLHVRGYSGTAGDSLIDTSYVDLKHAGMQFSSFDSDNDKSGFNCAKLYKGGWWYNSCLDANLNGPYRYYENIWWNGIIWYSWTSWDKVLKRVEMKIR